ncbi:MAG: alpha/beta fold hydrolase [Micavibrio sp.]
MAARLPLAERFTAPHGWTTGNFFNAATGRHLHFGYVQPQDAPRGVIVCLGGLSEFSEKYYEVARGMQRRGYAFWFMDWHYQGRSGRYKPYPQRRHSDGFDLDVSDLHSFIENHVAPATKAREHEYGTEETPFIMLGHSMGGNIGLHYLIKYPRRFDAAAFSAPLLGIYNFHAGYRLLEKIVIRMLDRVGDRYVFFGRDWHEKMRKSGAGNVFSSDPERDYLHRYWSATEPDLRVGNVTFRWVIEALKSCAALKEPGMLEHIDIPVLIAAAGKDRVVDNRALHHEAARLPHGQVLDISGARHEIMMERDEYRKQFFDAFDALLAENGISSR